MSEAVDTVSPTARQFSDFMQRRLAGLLLRRPDLFERYWHLLPKPKDPDNPYGLLLAAIDEFRKENDQVPTPEAIWDFLCNKTSVEGLDYLEQEVQPYLARPDPRDVAWIENGLVEFARSEVKAKVVTSIVRGFDVNAAPDEAVKDEDLRKALEDAIRDLDAVTGDGLNITEVKDEPVDPETAKEPAHSRMLQAPWDLLNEEIGGMRTGEICALTGVTGSGKSLFLQEICVQLRQRGQNVLLIDFENDLEDIVVSHALALTKTPFKDMTYTAAQNFIRKVREDAAKNGKPLGSISILPTRREMDATTLFEIVLHREREVGVTFDAVVIDYFDYLTDDEQMQVYRSPYIVQAKQLRLLGTYLRHYGKVAYVGFQTNREGARKKAAKEQVTSADVSGSFQKIMQVQHHMLIERGEGNSSKLRIDKCRRSGKLNGGDIAIQYEYVHAPTKTVARGFVKEVGVKRVDAKGLWLSKKKTLLDAIRLRNFSGIKGLRIHEETREKATFFRKVGVLETELMEWLGEPAVFMAAIDDLYDTGWLPIRPCRTAFADLQRKWVILESKPPTITPTSEGVTI